MKHLVVVFVGSLMWAVFSSPSEAQSPSDGYSHLSVPKGELILPEPTESELLPYYIAENIEKKGLVQDLECQALFHHVVEELDPAYKNQKKSIVRRAPDTSDPKIASSYLVHLTFSAVVNSHLDGSGLPEGFEPGPLVSTLSEGSTDESAFNTILEETFGECMPRFLAATEKHDAKKQGESLGDEKSEASE